MSITLVCSDCGAVIEDREKHAAWHEIWQIRSRLLEDRTSRYPLPQNPLPSSPQTVADPPPYRILPDAVQNPTGTVSPCSASCRPFVGCDTIHRCCLPLGHASHHQFPPECLANTASTGQLCRCGHPLFSHRNSYPHNCLRLGCRCTRYGAGDAARSSPVASQTEPGPRNYDRGDDDPEPHRELDKPVITVCLPGAGFIPGLPFDGWNKLYSYLIQQGFLVVLSMDIGSNIYNLRAKLLKALETSPANESEYVLWIDHDQVVSPEAFECLYQSMLQHPEFDIISGWTFMGTGGGPILVSAATKQGWMTAASIASATGDLIEVEQIGFPFVLMRTSLLVKMAPNPFRIRMIEEDGEQIGISEDTGFCKTAKENGARIAIHVKAYVPHIKPQELLPAICVPNLKIAPHDPLEGNPTSVPYPLSHSKNSTTRRKHGPVISLIHPTARVNFQNPLNWHVAMRAWLQGCDNPGNVQYVLTIHNRRWDLALNWGKPQDWLKPWGEVSFVRNTGLDTNISQVNRGYKAATGTVLVGIMDDLFPPEHWDTLLLEAIPNIDEPWVVHASSSSPRDAEPLINAGCMTRAWYDLQGGYCVHSDYEECSMFADNELTARAYAAGVVIPRLEGPDAIVFDHRHPVFGKGQMDEVYMAHNAPENYEKGRAVFERRRALGFPI